MTMIDPDYLEEQLKDSSFYQRILAFQNVTSTNEVARRLAESGAPSGTLVVADRQTAGRGRHGRSWHSPAGMGLWFSLLLRPRHPEDRWYLLPMVISEIVASTLKETLNIPLVVKWPNDVLYQQRKVCGILCESSSSVRAFEYIVAGIGINVNQLEEHFPEALRTQAISLRQIVGHELDRVALLLRLLKALAERLAPAVEGREEVRLRAWQTMCADLGEWVCLEFGEKSIEGVLRRVTDTGELVIEDQQQRLHTISYAEASLKKP